MNNINPPTDLTNLINPIIGVKRSADKISTLNDIVNTNDEVLNLARKIFVCDCQKEYIEKDLLLYQTGTYPHPTKSNITVSPHFVRDDGVIIYLQMYQKGFPLLVIDDDVIQLTMEIFEIKNTYVVTIYLKPDININEMGIANSKKLSECHTSIVKSLVRYDSHFSHKRSKKSMSDSMDSTNSTNLIDSTNSSKIVTGFIRDDWVSASKTRNYALSDTLVDWLEYHYDRSRDKKSFGHGKNTNQSESDYDFPKFLMNKGHHFEEHVVNLIKTRINSADFVTICPNMTDFNNKILEYEANTKTEILKGTPFLYQPLLMNRSGILTYSFGMPDLLVRSDYLHKIIDLNPLDESMRNFRAPKLKGDYHYVVVDIKFSTLELCADGKRIRNSGSVPAYKCQLYVYNHALGAIQGYEPTESYILGRKYKYNCRGTYYHGNSCFARFGHIEYDKWDHDYINETISAINWVKRLRTEGKEWVLLPVPSTKELYPNMCSTFETPWSSFKDEYARKIGDITLLWNCGEKNREIAHKNGIFSFKDDKCCAEKVGITGSTQKPILDEIIKINQQTQFNSALDRVKITLNNKLSNTWLRDSDLLLSVDFEIMNCIFDDFKTLPIATDQNYLFMIGVSYKTKTMTEPNYKMFMISQLSMDAEFQMIYQFYHFLRDLTDKTIGPEMEIPPLYHWGHIERSFFSGLCDRLIKKIGSDIQNDIRSVRQLKWIDMADCFKNNPIVINGCFKFGLKEVAGRLHELGLIKSIWRKNNPCNNGNSAMIMAYKAYQSAITTNTPINKVAIMTDIMEYNRIDCVVIHEIIDLLRRKSNN